MTKLISIIKTILNKLDSRLLGHGERVTFIVYKLLKRENKYDNKVIKDAAVFSLLHDIGALKTDDVDNLITFDSNNTNNHSIYGYLFMKYFSPLASKSEILLYHHTPVYLLPTSLSEEEKDISSLIHLADRIDVWMLGNMKNLVEIMNTTISTDAILNLMFKNNNHTFMDKYYQLLFQLEQEEHIIEQLLDGSYLQTLTEIDHMFKTYEIKRYLEMIVYAIDFRSYQTVTHSLLVAIIAKDMGKRLKLSNKECRNLEYSALLHDVGKVTTPINILEKAGRLTDEEMTIMRHHVIATKEIIQNYINPTILSASIHHHERSDGSGYPEQLTSNELSIEDNIIIIADIAAALIMKRSYKEPFPKEKTLAIFADLAMKNQISIPIYHLLCDNYDEIINNANKKIKHQENKFINIKEEYLEMLNKGNE